MYIDIYTADVVANYDFSLLDCVPLWSLTVQTVASYDYSLSEVCLSLISDCQEFGSSDCWLPKYWATG